MNVDCRIIQGNALDVLKTIESESVQCCVTSPPYFGLRDYGTAQWQGGDPACDHKHPDQFRTPNSKKQNSNNSGESARVVFHDSCGKCGAVRIDEQIGLEKTPQDYVKKLVAVFDEVHRVLKADGTLWLNLGDSYWTDSLIRKSAKEAFSKTWDKNQTAGNGGLRKTAKAVWPWKNKDLIGIPWRVAFALQEAGWYLRQDIIWCLSGGTYVYVKTQKGAMPIMIRDIARLDPATVRLWNGQKWTQLLGVSKSKRNNDELEMVLRSGERISCTPTHRFPTTRGLLEAADIVKGDILERSKLPEPSPPIEPQGVPTIAAWFLGLYLAEGSRSEDTIQISGHTKENDRLEMLRELVSFYGGSLTFTDKGNCRDIRIYSRLLNALIDTYISGQTAKNKRLTNRCWQHSNQWLRHLLDGYLHGDGHWEEKNSRWRLGFCRNYNLERDLRTMAARLSFRLVLNLSHSQMGERTFPSFRGEIRFEESSHQNRKDVNEIIEIRKSRCRAVYDLGVADDPHLFALASGILTHNSKPNPMPESVRDRCTKSHEYLFLLTKSPNYYYDQDAIREPLKDSSVTRLIQNIHDQKGSDRVPGKTNGNMKAVVKRDESLPRNRNGKGASTLDIKPVRIGGNKYGDDDSAFSRTKSGKEWQPVMAGSGAIYGSRSGYFDRETGEPLCGATANKKSVWIVATQPYKEAHFATFPEKLIEPCILAGSREGDLVLDPFSGSGTTGLVSLRHNRRYVGIELNPEYIEISHRRLATVQPKLSLGE